jgi:hypothetical protein
MHPGQQSFTAQKPTRSKSSSEMDRKSKSLAAETTYLLPELQHIAGDSATTTSKAGTCHLDHQAGLAASPPGAPRDCSAPATRPRSNLPPRGTPETVPPPPRHVSTRRARLPRPGAPHTTAAPPRRGRGPTRRGPRSRELAGEGAVAATLEAVAASAPQLRRHRRRADLRTRHLPTYPTQVQPTIHHLISLFGAQPATKRRGAGESPAERVSAFVASLSCSGGRKTPSCRSCENEAEHMGHTVKEMIFMTFTHYYIQSNYRVQKHIHLEFIMKIKI